MKKRHIIFIYRKPETFECFSKFIPKLSGFHRCNSIAISMISCQADDEEKVVEETYQRLKSTDVEEVTILVLADATEFSNPNKYHVMWYMTQMSLENGFVPEMEKLAA